MRGPIPGFKGHVAVAVTCIALFLGAAAWLLHTGGGLPSFGADDYTVQALVPSAQSVASGAQVTMAGAPIGTVTGVRRRGLGAVLTLRLSDRAVTPLRADATAQIRARTPIGENYVELQPGRSDAALRDGGQLRVAAGEGFVDIDKVLSTLQGATRQRARDLVQGASRGLRGQGARLNGLLGGVSATLDDGSTVVSTLVDNREQTGRLVAELGTLAQAIGDRQDAVARTADRGLVAFRAIADRDVALRRLLRVLPSTLDTVRSTSGTLRSTAVASTPVIAGLAGVTRRLRPAVQRLRPAATNARGIVTDLGATAPGLGRTFDRLRSLSGPAASALPSVRKTLCQINPVLRYSEPYTPDVIQTIVGLASASNAYDAIGHTIRILPVIGENSLVGLPADVSKSVLELMHAGVLTKLTGLSYDPYPKPGSIGHSKAEDFQHDGKPIVGPDGTRESGFRYPRVEADC